MGGGVYTDDSTVLFTNVDLGAGHATNRPNDVHGCADDWGVGASFTIVGSGCE